MANPTPASNSPTRAPATTSLLSSTPVSRGCFATSKHNSAADAAAAASSATETIGVTRDGQVVVVRGRVAIRPNESAAVHWSGG